MTQNQMAVTNANGIAAFNTFDGPGTYTLTIDDITKPGYLFDPNVSVLEESITVP
ncbi:MAG: hypothetical protein ACRDIB_11575 [Ardenticatenaceae bacterium]